MLVGLSAIGYPPDAELARYDALFLAALGLQIALIASGLESLAEARVIFVFHLVGTVMEIFKTSSVGLLCEGGAPSWTYPEKSLFRIADVPLFTGFMYASVGSYIARSWRLFDFRFERHPSLAASGALALAAYVNFFANRCLPDTRLALFAVALYLFWRTRLDLEVAPGRRLRLPLLALFLGVAALIYAAENIGTAARIWVYPHQAAEWAPVSPQKLGSWFLLMLLSWTLVGLIQRPDRT